MQESSPLLLPTRPTSQHDDESNQNNAQQKRYAGRKKKKKLTTLQDKVADATRLLKEQIAKANIITSQSHGPSVFSRQEEQQSPESTSSGSRGTGRRPPSPLSPTTLDVTNYNETDSNSYATTTSLFTSSESNEHHRLHERLQPLPPDEVMDISSPLTTGGVTDYSSPQMGVTDNSSPSTAVTDYSSPPLGVMGFSSPPLEAMGYYSPPPLGAMDMSSPPMAFDVPDYASSPPPVEIRTHFLPVHPLPHHHHFPIIESTESKLDWGSGSEDEEDEDLPPPLIEDPRDQPPQSDVILRMEGSGEGLSLKSLPTPDEAQEIIEEEEDEEVIPRTISESEVERLHADKIGNLNGNYDSSGSFREWHETLRVQTYGGEELLILPYTVIDF